jgi:hypothetical protein
LPLFDEDTRATFKDPGLLLISEGQKSIPAVKVNGSGVNVLAVYRKLDEGKRIVRQPFSSVRADLASGLLCVHKDAEKDRLIRDSRPPNPMERPLLKWTWRMGSAMALTHVVVPHDMPVLLWAGDLVDNNYQFAISELRAARNALSGRMDGFRFVWDGFAIVPSCMMLTFMFV